MKKVLFVAIVSLLVASPWAQGQFAPKCAAKAPPSDSSLCSPGCIPQAEEAANCPAEAIVATEASPQNAESDGPVRTAFGTGTFAWRSAAVPSTHNLITSFADVPPGAPQGAGSAPAPPQPDTSAEELAKKLSNPIASLISVPFSNNFDFGMGPNEDGFRYAMNFQPVIPITLNKDWNMISRTIVPIIHQSDVIGTSSQTGLGDMVQSLFFSPNKAEPFVWGIGPVFLLPTATDELLGAKKFGLGPTLVILKQKRGWTYGALFNHIESVAGDDSRPHVSSTLLQPFLSYTTRKAWTFSLNTESTYDWTGEQWSVPIHATVSKLVRFGKQPVSFAGALRCWATSPSGGPQNCGFRLSTTLLFPK